MLIMDDGNGDQALELQPPRGSSGHYIIMYAEETRFYIMAFWAFRGLHDRANLQLSVSKRDCSLSQDGSIKKKLK